MIAPIEELPGNAVHGRLGQFVSLQTTLLAESLRCAPRDFSSQVRRQPYGAGSIATPHSRMRFANNILRACTM
jgi:hypothetical protein